MDALTKKDNHFELLVYGLLAVRFIQGFIYWGGGSRRFIYAPAKLDPHAVTWMANKFQSAMPGALFGFDHIVSFMLTHFWLLYAGVILFSLAELVFGLFLILGLFTRLSAFISMILSVVLMILFGWQGATCIDEWTMAACNLAMGCTLFLCGTSVYALDNVLYRRKPQWQDKNWLRWIMGSYALPLASPQMKKLALILLAFVIVFDVGTYSHYRGSVVTPFHSGPVSPTTHHLSIDSATLSGTTLSFHVYLDAGTPEAPVHVMDAWLKNADGQTLYHWDNQTLAALPASAVVNDYKYNLFKPATYGLQAAMGAKATITLPLNEALNASDGLRLQLRDASGHDFTANVKTTD